MKERTRKVPPEYWLAAAAAVVLLISLVIGVKSLLGRSSASPRDDSAASSLAAGSSAPTEVTLEKPKKLRGASDPEEDRLNYFLTSIVQQDILNTATDLDDDAELVRFVFRYRKTNDPSSILEEEDGSAACRSLTLEQINETLSKLFGKTVSPDREDYSLVLENDETFHCVYRDGRFLNTAPFPTETYSFPLWFAITEKIDEENCTLHFRLYRINPGVWGEGEAERHVGVMPAGNVVVAEMQNQNTKDWYTFVGEGDAKLRDLGKDLQLVEMEGSMIQGYR